MAKFAQVGDFCPNGSCMVGNLHCNPCAGLGNEKWPNYPPVGHLVASCLKAERLLHIATIIRQGVPVHIGPLKET